MRRRSFLLSSAAAIGFPSVAECGRPDKFLGRRYALIFGCSNYQKAPWQELPNAKYDAMAMKHELKHLGWVVKSFHDGNLDKATIEDEIEDFIKDCGKNGNMLMMYFSGHGFQSPNKNDYIVPEVIKANDLNNVVSASWILDKAIDNKNSFLFCGVLDCCRTVVNEFRDDKYYFPEALNKIVTFSVSEGCIARDSGLGVQYCINDQHFLECPVNEDGVLKVGGFCGPFINWLRGVGIEESEEKKDFNLENGINTAIDSFPNPIQPTVDPELGSFILGERPTVTWDHLRLKSEYQKHSQIVFPAAMLPWPNAEDLVFRRVNGQENFKYVNANKDKDSADVLPFFVASAPLSRKTVSGILDFANDRFTQEQHPKKEAILDRKYLKLWTLRLDELKGNGQDDSSKEYIPAICWFEAAFLCEMLSILCNDKLKTDFSFFLEYNEFDSLGNNISDGRKSKLPEARAVELPERRALLKFYFKFRNANTGFRLPTEAEVLSNLMPYSEYVKNRKIAFPGRKLLTPCFDQDVKKRRSCANNSDEVKTSFAEVATGKLVKLQAISTGINNESFPLFPVLIPSYSVLKDYGRA